MRVDRRELGRDTRHPRQLREMTCHRDSGRFFSLSLSFSCDVVSSNMYLVVVSMGSQCRMCYAAAETSRQPHRHSTYAYGESDEGNFTNMDTV